MTSGLGRGIDAALGSLDNGTVTPLPDDNTIPTNPQAFYESFGYLQHPRTHKPVRQLADYQVRVWKSMQENPRTLVIKSNRLGLSTSCLLAVFQAAVLPLTNPYSCRGYDILVLAQSNYHASEHLRTLRKLVAGSARYSGFLVTHPTEGMFRDEQSKVNTLYIRNPDKESQPTRIVALGVNQDGQLASWKNVKLVMASDVTQAGALDITGAMHQAEVRLATTEGHMVIETIPSPPEGYVFDLYQANRHAGSRWKVFEIPATEAVKAGVLTQEFLESERQSKGVLFPPYYSAQFVAGGGNLFEPAFIDRCTIDYDLAGLNGYSILSLDPAFGSSKFGLVAAVKVGAKVYILEAKQFARPSPAAMIDTVTRLYHERGYSTCLVDGSQAGFCTDLQKQVRVEPINYNEKLQDIVWSTHRAIQEQSVYIRPAFHELIAQLKTVSFNEKGLPDKTKLSYDLGDAFSQAVWYLLKAGGGKSVIVKPGAWRTRPYPVSATAGVFSTELGALY